MSDYFFDHNDERFLVVRCLATGRAELSPGRSVPQLSPAWYVVRDCPCHRNKPVTMPYPTRARAEAARQAILAADSPRALRPRLARPRMVQV